MIFKGFCAHTHFSSFYTRQAPEPDESRCRALSPEPEPPSPSPKRVTMRSVGARTAGGQMGCVEDACYSPLLRHYQIDLCCVISSRRKEN